MYEPHHHPLISRPAFIRRVINHGGFSLVIIGVSLGIGMVGYHGLANLSWIDSLLNAAMILGGEGPVDRLDSSSAKIFASVYALYSGLILLAAVGIAFAPVFHRLMHSLHLEKNR